MQIWTPDLRGHNKHALNRWATGPCLLAQIRATSTHINHVTRHVTSTNPKQQPPTTSNQTTTTITTTSTTTRNDDDDAMTTTTTTQRPRRCQRRPCPCPHPRLRPRPRWRIGQWRGRWWVPPHHFFFVHPHHLTSGDADMPASTQMTESPINTNTKSGGMRVEGRVTHPPKSTPTKRRYVAVMWYDEERRRMTMFWRRTTTRNDKY